MQEFIEILFKHMSTNPERKSNDAMRMLHILLGAVLLTFTLGLESAVADPYSGSRACGECHPEQYERFTSHSRKSVSWNSVAIMASDLKPFELEQCYGCHTTGHGQGGFVSIEQTPQLADVGCETCHGPGGEHAASGNPAFIKKAPGLETCGKCHNPERVRSFKFKPLIYGGAH